MSDQQPTTEVTPRRSERPKKRKVSSPDSSSPSSTQQPRPPPTSYKRKPRTSRVEEGDAVERIHDMQVNEAGEVEYFVPRLSHVRC